MKLVTFAADGRDHVGVLIEDEATVVSLTTAAPDEPAFASMRALIEAGPNGLERARELVTEHPISSVHALTDVRLRAPIPNPPRMRDCCLFIAHFEPAMRGAARMEAQKAEDPEAEYERLIASGRFDVPKVLGERVIYYNADPLSVSGPGDVIVAPPTTSRLDYELEFAAVIGVTGRDFDKVSAADAIFGYTIFNDWSCRDTQVLVMQSTLGPAEGKDFDGGTTLGPCIVTADELPSPYELEMVARINGEEWSRGNSRTMHHSFEDAVVQFSRGKTVHAGEVLGSGTVLSGSGVENGRWLKDGDVVELEVEGIGILRNRVQLRQI